MARALIVGCGCRGQALGRRLAAEGWEVRGTTRTDVRVDEIRSAGIEPAVADPDRVGTVLEQVSDVTAVVWLLGNALGEPEVVAAVHGPRLERMMEKLVDTPVRGVLYEAAGRVQPHHLNGGAEIVRQASERWSIPVEILETDPAEHTAWLDAAAGAVIRLAR